MAHRSAGDGRRVLISAPFGRDAESVAHLLSDEGYDTVVCAGLRQVADHFDDRTGAILLTEEALQGDLAALKGALGRQNTWSDVPFVLLAAPARGRAPDRERSRLQLFDLTTNSVVLERPLGKASLLSAVASALRARQKQFDMRDRLAELDESESRLRLATQAADIGTWDYDPIRDVLQWDDRCKALFGLPPEAAISYDGAFVAGLHPDDRAASVSAVSNALRPGGDGTYEIEYRTVGPIDGVERWLQAKGGAIFQDGRAVRFIGTVIDITQRKSAEAQLDRFARTLEAQVQARTADLAQEMASRAQAEEALRQSQKMEAVGQLTGGIAHDFNNMLTGVIGSLDIVRRRIETGRLDDVDRFMDAASTSAQRAAALTARLLAFSRRQSLDPQPLEVNGLLASLEDLILRSTGENITLSLIAGTGVKGVIADANQLENAVLNLAINARDAMPSGGELTISTALVEIDAAYAAAKPGIDPGAYVMIAVTDTGQGMSPDVLKKVFDPFFTTKPIGQGTGLGLSMVYGFARQSNGQVRIHSRPGEGTSVKLYLPATDLSGAPVASEPPAVLPEGQGQTVLIVEDDPSVRQLVREVLTELSYAVVEAGSADEALPILDSEQAIALMISDVGLPGMNGRQLAEIAKTLRPALNILFVTGYAETAAHRGEFLGQDMDMITKPFALQTLALKVGELIGPGIR